MPFDTIIENPSIYDGTGRLPFRNDIGLLGDRIESIGDLRHAQAQRRIDGSSLACCPGFIDAHSHADMTLIRSDHPSILEPLVRQGITTFVGGNCGVSMAPVGVENRDVLEMFWDFFLGSSQKEVIKWKTFGEMLAHCEGQGMLLNAGILAPHGMIRMNVMGERGEVAGPAHLAAMQRLLAQCLEAGALGMSVGLAYFPGLWSNLHELVQLARVVHDFNGVFSAHLRSYNSDTLRKAMDEVFQVGLEAQVPVQISHLLYVPNYPSPLNHLARLALRAGSMLYKHHPHFSADAMLAEHLNHGIRLIEKGHPIGFDTMPTSAGFTHLLAFFPPWCVQGGVLGLLDRLADPRQRKKIRQSIEGGDLKWPHREGDSWSMNLFKSLGWSGTYIMSVKSEKNQSVLGKNLMLLAEERGCHPFDVACDLLVEEGGRVLVFETATFPGDPFVETSLQAALVSSHVSIVTDSILLGFGLPSHLFYDCFPKFLSQYAIDRKLLPLTEAIRKCTSLPADQLGIRHRGRLLEGNYADLVLFDLERLSSRSTPSEPARFPQGLHSVFINGHAVLNPEGFHPNPLPGRMIRRGSVSLH